MLLEIYKLISKMQSEIGNDAEVRLSVKNDILFIKVDWWIDDFHAKNEYKEIELAKIAETEHEEPINRFVAFCKEAYARRSSTGS